MFTKIAATYTHQYLTHVHGLPPDLLAISRIRSSLYHVHNWNTCLVLSPKNIYTTDDKWDKREPHHGQIVKNEQQRAFLFLKWCYGSSTTILKKKMRQVCCKIEPLLCLFTIKKALTDLSHLSTEYQISQSINKSPPKYLHISTKWNQTKTSHQSTKIIFEILEWGGASLKPCAYKVHQDRGPLHHQSTVIKG